MHKVSDQFIRPFRSKTDADVVLALINKDALPGQPRVDIAMLGEALRGRSAVDAGWWKTLKKPKVDVLVVRGEIVGVVSFAEHRREDSAFLLWMHAAEDPEPVRILVDHVLAATTAKKIHAFYIATALTSGLEALPFRHRPVTHAAMLAAGCRDIDLWRYMRLEHPSGKVDRLDPHHYALEDGKNSSDWKISLRNDGAEIGFAYAGSLFPGIGVLWFIHIDADRRGNGLGRRLLGTVLDRLVGTGAQEVILYVDDDEPGGERDKTAANRLYDSLGFLEIDRLHSYELDRTTS